MARGARAQEAPPPAYLAAVEGDATLERNGESEPAVRDMPFVAGDRLRTTNGRVEIEFPDGTAIEVAEYSEVEALSPTRVRLIAGTFDHLPQRTAERADSAQYLPPDLQPYGRTFDQNGTWGYSAPYGYVWYPTVAPDWRPYYYGTWSAVPSYGWTWVGLDAWSWPTHHYGRWGNYRNAWFWIPGRTWAPAWVSWGSAADYVSWCPLGYDNRPVFALSTGYDRPWNGWTVLSRSHFGGRGYYAHRYAIDPGRVDRRTPFLQQAHAPIAVPHERARQANDDRRGDNYRGAERRTTNPSYGVAVPRRAYPIEAPRAAESSVAPLPRYRAAAPEHAAPIAGAPTAQPGYRIPQGNANRAVPRYTAPPTPVAPAPAAAPPPASAPPPARYRPPTAESRPAGDAPRTGDSRQNTGDSRSAAGTARERGAGDAQPSDARRRR